VVPARKPLVVCGVQRLFAPPHTSTIRSPSTVLCPATSGMSTAHIQSCRNFERVWPNIHCFQRDTFGLGTSACSHPHKHHPQPSPVLCRASSGMSTAHIESCRNFERVWPNIHCFQRDTFGLGNSRPVAREHSRGNSEICQVAFTSGPNNFPATKACLQLPYDIQSEPRHNWRFKFSSTRRHSLEWSPYMTPKFLGLHDCCSLVPKKPRAPACTHTYNLMTPQFSAGSYVPKASITTCRKLVTHYAHGTVQCA
jgi:hypothetical protein